MVRCDVCDKEHEYGVGLKGLRSDYKVNGISDLCESCSATINRYKEKELTKALDAMTERVKAKLLEMKYGKEGLPRKKRWWHRFTRRSG